MPDPLLRAMQDALRVGHEALEADRRMTFVEVPTECVSDLKLLQDNGVLAEALHDAAADFERMREREELLQEATNA